MCRRLAGWPISTTMFDAVLDQHQSRDEGIWIDAICIDQSNPTEKLHAVGSMDAVYRSARLVVIVLEDVYLSNREADYVRLLLAQEQKGPIAREDLPTTSLNFSHLLSSRWITRAWCSHEYQLSAKSLFLVPTDSGILQITITTISDLRALASSMVPAEFPILGFKTLERSSAYRHTKWYKRWPIAQFNGIIELNSLFEADKIGIGVNVAGFQLYYTGDEVSVDQCRWTLVMLALCAGDLSVLCGSGPAISVGADVNVSSWLRWNMNLENFVAALSDPALPEHPHIVSINPAYIVLDLLVFEHCSLHNPSTDSVLIATAFLDQYAKEFSRSNWANKDATTPSLQCRRRRDIEVLACSLDCGLPWLMGNMNHNQDLEEEMRWKIKVNRRDLWPLVANLLLDAYPAEEIIISSLTSEQKRSITQYLYFVLTNIGLSVMPSFYSSGIFNPNERQYVRFDWGTVCGKSLMIIGQGEIPECQFALPAVLSGTVCATMDRLWLLKPRDSTTGDEWSILEMVKLVTTHVIEEDGTNLVRQPAQTIRG